MKDVKIGICSMIAIPCLCLAYLFHFAVQLATELMNSLVCIFLGIGFLLIFAYWLTVFGNFSIDSMLMALATTFMILVAMGLAFCFASAVILACVTLFTSLCEGIGRIFWNIFYSMVGGITNAAKGK